MKHLNWLAILLAAGCTPTLSEGRFDCTDGACPSGWSCRLSDRRCYASAPLDAGPFGDAFAPRAFFEPCQRNTDCASGECYFGDLETHPTGYCTQPCMGDSECVGLVPGTMIECNTLVTPRVCTMLCGVDALPCPMGSVCAFLDRPAAGEEYGDCLAPGFAPQPVDALSCTGDEECVVGICTSITSAPLACARPCGGEGVCAPGESCVASSRGTVCAL